MNIFAPFKTLIGREPKLRRLAAMKAERETKIGPLRQTLQEATAERQRIVDILDGKFVRTAEKELARAIGPIDSEISSLSRELQSAPPAVLQDFIAWAEWRIAQLQDALNEPHKVLKVSHLGTDALEVEQFSNDEIRAVIEELRKRMNAAGDLATAEISDSELKKEIDGLRNKPLPEIRKIRFERESVQSEWRESA